MQKTLKLIIFNKLNKSNLIGEHFGYAKNADQHHYMFCSFIFPFISPQ